MAEKALDGVRTIFVESVSTPMIKALLDHLYRDRVLNRGEADSVIEDQPGRADRARKLIDTVVMKGDAASRAMIKRLQEQDRELSDKLGLQGGSTEPKPPQKLLQKPPQEQQWSTELIPCTDEFWRKKKDDENVYPVTKEAIRSRVALLITNIKFTDPDNNRHGAEKDEKNMKKHLESLGYEVVKRTNLTGKAIDDAVIEFSKHPKLKGTDSVVVVIMSHGELGAILGVNHTEETPDKFPINNIYTHLGSERCPALLNKPKIIIIQACRGGKKGSVQVRDDGPSFACDDFNIQPGELEDDTVQYVHDEKDFIALHSSTPDTVSYRDPILGSLLILSLVDVVNTLACTEHIEELFRMVMKRFGKFVGEFGGQMPTKERCNLNNHFYFFPGQ